MLLLQYQVPNEEVLRDSSFNLSENLQMRCWLPDN